MLSRDYSAAANSLGLCADRAHTLLRGCAVLTAERHGGQVAQPRYGWSMSRFARMQHSLGTWALLETKHSRIMPSAQVLR